MEKKIAASMVLFLQQFFFMVKQNVETEANNFKSELCKYFIYQYDAWSLFIKLRHDF